MTKLLKTVNQTTIILLALILFGLFLRVVDINNIPKAIYGDGLTLVYDAYSISKTGHDQNGNFLPFIFQLGDHRPPGYVYATVPFAAILGPTPLAANAVSILSGLGVIILLFLIGRKFYSTRVGLIAAFFGTISSWELSLSRGPFETHLALFLVLFGIYCYFKSKEKAVWLILTSLSFGLSSLTYPTYGLSAPLILILLLMLDQGRRNLLKKHLGTSIIAGTITLVCILLSFSVVHTGSDQTRVESINIFNQQDVKQQIITDINLDRNLDTLPGKLDIYFHNQFWSYFTLVFENYVENFRPGFLLIHGDAQPRHNPSSTGQIYWIFFILLIGGLVYLYGRKNEFLSFWPSHKILLLLIGWILLVPIATAFVGPPHALRDSLMLPPLLLLTAFGMEKLIASKRRIKPLIVGLVVILFLTEFAFFIDEFYFVSPNKYSRFWADPAKKASLMALEDKQKFDFVILSTRIDNMEFAYPVYAKLDPQRVITQNKTAGIDLNGAKLLKYDNVYIGTIAQSQIKDFLNQLPGSIIYIGPSTDKDYLDNPQVSNGPDLMPDLAISQKN